MTRSTEGSTAALVDRQQQQVTELFVSSVPDWERIYQRDDVYSVIYQRRRMAGLALIDELDLPCDARILEVGCGPGLTTLALAKKNYRIHAMDIVPAMVSAALQRAAPAGLDKYVEASVGDVRRLAFKTCTFDAVLVIGVTEWMASIPALCEELFRVIKPAGYLVISSDNSRALHLLVNPLRHPALAGVRQAILAGWDRVVRRTGRVRTFACSEVEFDRHLCRAGLPPIKSRHLGFGPFSFLGLPLIPNALGLKLDRTLQAWADGGVAWLKTAGHVYVVAAKKTRTVHDR